MDHNVSYSQFIKVSGGLLVFLGSYLLWKTWSSLPRKKHKSAVVSKLVIYPIKSCKGVEVKEAKCTALGLVSGQLRDRQYMIAEADTGKFVSVRTQPKLVLVTVSMDESADMMCISAPGMTELRVPLGSPPNGDMVPGSVWNSQVTGVDCGKEASDWFSNYLTSSVKLLYFDESICERPLEKLDSGAFTRQQRPVEANAKTMFADGYPYLLCNELSVNQINVDVGEEVATWENFRPNILVSGAERAYVEDDWRDIEINGVELFAEKPCGRCSLPNVNPQSGIRHPKAEPFNTLYKTRLQRQYDKKSPIFGMNLILDGEEGIIRVGDSLMC